MFLIGEQLRQEMISAEVGVWLVSPDNETTIHIVVKLPTPVIKSIYKGSLINFWVFVLQHKDAVLNFLGIEVFDTELPYFAFSQHKKSDTHQRIVSVFGQDTIRLHLFDEMVTPVLSAD